MNPAHYKAGDPLELINVIEHYGLHHDFCLATAITYIFRAGHKVDSNPEVDLLKAIWYLERRIKEGFEEE